MADNFFNVRNGISLGNLSSDPSNPVNGDFYYNTTFEEFRGYSNGSWGSIGGSAGSSKNYLSQYVSSTGGGTPNAGNGNFETGGTSGWSLANTALTNFIPSSTASAGTPFSSSAGGSPASSDLSLSVVSSGQLAGRYSGSLVSSAASTAGDMIISEAFNIDTEDQGKPMTFQFFYEAVSGTFNFSGSSANSFAVYIYDVTNGAWIQPAGAYNVVQGLGVGMATGTFQSTSNSTQYQLAVININSTSGAYTFYLDDFFVGPQPVVTGVPATDWIAYTPTFVGFGTPTNVAVFSKRIGDELLIAGSFISGSSTGSTASISLGYNGINGTISVDQTKISSSNNILVGEANNGASGSSPLTCLIQPSSNVLNFGIVTGSTSPTSPATGSSLVGSGSLFTFFAYIPIAGWSSNVDMSQDTSTRVVAITAHLSSNSSVGANNPIIFDTVDFDTHSTYNSSTGIYTVPVSGKYSVSATSTTTSASAGFYVQKNSAKMAYLGLSESGNLGAGSSTTINCVAGDTLQVNSDSSATFQGGSGPYYCSLSIERVSGPATIAASETVSASYYCSTDQSASPSTPINFDTSEFDDHGAVTTGSGWNFTAPIPGLYQVSGMIFFINAAITLLYKNGSVYKGGFIQSPASSTGGAGGCILVRLLAGDYIDIRPNGSISVGGGGLAGGNTSNINIVRVGN